MEVGVSSLTGGRRLPSQQLVGLEGSGRGRLGSGGTAGWLSDPLRPSTSSIREQLVGLEGSGRGRLGSGGTAGWLSDPLRPSTSSIRASAFPAGVLPPLHQGSRLKPGASKPSSEG